MSKKKKEEFLRKPRRGAPVRYPTEEHMPPERVPLGKQEH